MSPTHLLWLYFSGYRPRLVGFALCCGIAVFMAWKRRDAFFGRLCRYIVIPSLLLLAAIVNPLTAPFLISRGEGRAARFYWLIPVALLLAIVTAWLLTRLPARRQKPAAALAAVLLLLTFAGNFRYLHVLYLDRFTNWYKIPEVVIQLDDWIMDDDAGLEKTAVFPWPLNMWVRQYRAEIVIPFAWRQANWFSETDVELYLMFADSVQPAPDAVLDPVDLDKMDALAMEGGYNYLVLDTTRAYTGSLKDFEEVWRIDTDPAQDTTAYDREYILYRLAEKG